MQKNMTISVTDDLLRQFRILCAKRETTMSKEIQKFMQKEINKNGSKNT